MRRSRHIQYPGSLFRVIVHTLGIEGWNGQPLPPHLLYCEISNHTLSLQSHLTYSTLTGNGAQHTYLSALKRLHDSDDLFHSCYRMSHSHYVEEHEDLCYDHVYHSCPSSKPAKSESGLSTHAASIPQHQAARGRLNPARHLSAKATQKSRRIGAWQSST
jgi:hypothetical protein